MKRFTNGRGFWCPGGKSAKNYREKSVDVVGYDELAAFDADIEKEGSPTFPGISVLRVLFGPNPYAAQHQNCVERAR